MKFISHSSLSQESYPDSLSPSTLRMRFFTHGSVSRCLYRMNAQDDDEEVARERRRQARQERLRNKENEESNSTTGDANRYYSSTIKQAQNLLNSLHNQTNVCTF